MKIKDRSQAGFSVIKGVLLTILSVLCVLPFVVIVSGSFTSNQEIIRNGFSLLPRDFTVEAYKTIFRTPEDILQAYKMNAYYTGIGTALGLIIITLTAYVISRKEFKYRNTVSFLIYFTTMTTATTGRVTSEDYVKNRTVSKFKRHVILTKVAWIIA